MTLDSVQDSRNQLTLDTEAYEMFENMLQINVPQLDLITKSEDSYSLNVM